MGLGTLGMSSIRHSGGADRSVRSGEPGDPLLSVRGLTVEFLTDEGRLRAVDDVSFDLRPGEILGIVGESGSGKSVTVLSMLGLVPQPAGRVVAGEIIFEGRDLLRLTRKELKGLRGKDIGMVFQDPMTSLNPVMKVGFQIAETLRVHDRSMSKREARARAVELLRMVGVPDPEDRSGQYPHEYSGGMRQRAMIAIAMANSPKVLVADEPTTALDVSIQAQVLKTLRTAQDAIGAATILITHDLALVAELADRAIVMYGGRVVEVGDVRELFSDPRHPYTLGLLASIPRLESDAARLVPIPGNPPSPVNLPPGCAFHPRCGLRDGRERCVQERPGLYSVASGHQAACHFHEEMPAEVERIRDETGITALGGGS